MFLYQSLHSYNPLIFFRYFLTKINKRKLLEKNAGKSLEKIEKCQNFTTRLKDVNLI